VKVVDYLIVGHGLAGATLAWQLEHLGQSVAVVDRESANTASRVAAGLISPVTGKRNAASHRFDEFWREAEEFYRRLEEQSGERLLYVDRTLKVVDQAQLLGNEASLVLKKPYRALPVMELHGAARLDVAAFLDSSRRRLQARQAYFSHDLDLPKDVSVTESQVNVSALGLSARMIVFCQGIDAQSNTWLSDLSFEPAKGEILEVESDELSNGDTVLGDVWVVPQSKARCAVGATYERDFNDAAPSEKGRESILRRLNELTDCEVNVVNHRAAIRPILTGRLPKIGVPQLRIGFFNGLGSKGSFRAPKVSRQFAEHLVLGRQVDAEFWLDLTKDSRRLTEVAQAVVLPTLGKGAIAIDATTGNGFDTLFLSRSVGDCGHVFGIDLQDEALKRTAARLAASDAKNVTLLCRSHAELDQLIPREHHGCVSAVMFNLGYLPRGDKELTTTVKSTIEAIKKSVEMLRSGGVLSVIAYTGHAGGIEEAESVEALLSDVDFRMRCTVKLPPTRLCAGPPRHYLATRI